jgi:hypothetical protein
VFLLTVDKAIGAKEVFEVGVHQLSKRFYCTTPGFEYASLKVMIGKWDKDQLVFIDGDFKMDQSVFLQLGDLDAGQYFIFVKPNWSALH